MKMLSEVPWNVQAIHMYFLAATVFEAQCFQAFKAHGVDWDEAIACSPVFSISNSVSQKLSHTDELPSQ